MNLVQEIERAKLSPRELLRFLDEPRRDLTWADPRDRAVLAETEFVARTLEIPMPKLFRELGILPEIRGAAGMTSGYSELYYTSIAAATELNTFTTEDNLQKTLQHIIIPAGWAQVGRSLRCKWTGRLGTTGTPTFTFNARLLTSTTWSAGGVGVATAAITAGSGITLGPWELELEIICRTLGAGGASNTTLVMIGFIRAGTAFAAGGGVYSVPAANTAFTVTLDHAATQYLYLSVACGTSNAANKVAVELIKIHSEN